LPVDPLPLLQQHCQPIGQGVAPLAKSDASAWLQQLPHWQLSGDGKQISRQARFTDYCQTMAFVNAVAWVAHQQDHHPQLVVGYNHVTVTFTTHILAGLSLNDFICAAKVDHLLAP